MSPANAVVLELGRHLREGGYGPQSKRDATLAAAGRSNRPDTLSLVEAISRASGSMREMNNRIGRSEDDRRKAEEAFNRLQVDYSELCRRQQTVQAKAALDAERAQRAEAKLAMFQEREERVVADLEKARSESEQLAEAVLDFIRQEEQVSLRPSTARNRHSLASTNLRTSIG